MVNSPGSARRAPPQERVRRCAAAPPASRAPRSRQRRRWCKSAAWQRSNHDFVNARGGPDVGPVSRTSSPAPRFYQIASNGSSGSSSRLRRSMARRLPRFRPASRTTRSAAPGGVAIATMYRPSSQEHSSRVAVDLAEPLPRVCASAACHLY